MATPLAGPETGIPPLRPLSVGDLLDAVFRLYRNHFLLFIGIAGLAQLPLVLFQLVVGVGFDQRFATDLLTITEELPFFDPSEDSLTDLPLGTIAAYIGFVLLLGLAQVIVVQQLVNGALANAIARIYHGQATSMLGAYNLGGKRIAALIGVGGVVALISMVIGLVFFAIYLGAIFGIIALATSSNGAGAVIAGLLGFGALLLIFLALFLGVAFLWIRLLFTTQAVVIEGLGPFAALGRSWRLIRGAFWRTFGLYLLLTILIQILVGVPVGIAAFAMNFAFGVQNDPLANYTLRQAITTAISYLAQIIVLPIQLSAFTLLYYDLRVRKEGYDLALRLAPERPEAPQ